METDALDYALAAILSIVNEDNKVHPVSFHSCTFTVVELNYNTHDKELLAIFEAFKIWWHYLEGLAYPINVVTDYWNLEYFSTTKVLTQRQAWWSEYLSQFNLVIKFCPGCLSTKLDTLTRQWDVYPKGGSCCSNYLLQWQMILLLSKSLSRVIMWEFHKRTQQGVSAKLEFYIYKTCLVHATNI